jgi:hypothetical protein
LIVRREDPASIPVEQSPPITDFPTGALAEAEQPSARPPTRAAASPVDVVSEFSSLALRELKLKDERASSFSAIFSELASRMRARPDNDFAEDAAWADAQVLALLGEDKNEEYLRYRRRYVAQRQ